MEEQNRAKTAPGSGLTSLQTTDCLQSCRQIAIVIMNSCNNDRYASGRDDNSCCRQNTVRIFFSVKLPWLRTHLYACVSIPHKAAVPRWPVVWRVWSTPPSVAREEVTALDLAFPYICFLSWNAFWVQTRWMCILQQWQPSWGWKRLYRDASTRRFFPELQGDLFRPMENAGTLKYLESTEFSVLTGNLFFSL